VSVGVSVPEGAEAYDGAVLADSVLADSVLAVRADVAETAPAA
jgi:hypothetical protein